MKISTIIEKRYETVILEDGFPDTITLEKPVSFQIGEIFENYVRKVIFPKSNYHLLEKTQSYISDRDMLPESCKLPDFKLRDKLTKQEFYLEIKFRSNRSRRNYLNLLKNWQLKYFQEIQNETPVFVILGVGNDPDDPEFLSLIPLTRVRFTRIYSSEAKQFEIPVKKEVKSNRLWQS